MAETTTTCIASLGLLFIILLIFIYFTYFAGFQPENKQAPYGPDQFNKGNAFGRGKILQTTNNDFTLQM